MGNLNDIEYVLQVSEARGNPVTEKRAAVRVVPTRAVTIALATGGDERLAYGVIEDISCGGARVVSDTAPPVGQWVGVALSFPREKQLFETRCRIVWLRPGPLVHWGVQFEPASGRLAELRALIDGVSVEPLTSH